MNSSRGELVPLRRPGLRTRRRSVVLLRRGVALARSTMADPRARAVVTAVAAVGTERGLRHLAGWRRSLRSLDLDEPRSPRMAGESGVTWWAARVVEVRVVRRTRG